jgi:hypothetical protein
MVRKSPDKQWNLQNSILFHETIPLTCIMSERPCSENNTKGIKFAIMPKIFLNGTKLQL